MPIQGNGAGPALDLESDAREITSQSTLEHIRTELAELVEAEAQVVDELTAKVNEARARLAQYSRALTALTGEPAKAQGRLAAKQHQPHAGKWQASRASPKLRGAVTSVLGDGRPRTVKEITEASGYTDSAVRKALDDLRTDQVIRRTGKPGGPRGRGAQRSGFRYALMPKDPTDAT